MESTSQLRTALRGHPAVRRIVASWRQLTGGDDRRDETRTTLVACSGGADSSALVLALATTAARIHIGHIVHDMRSAAESEKDASRVKELALLAGCGITTANIQARPLRGNLEALSRKLRYAQLGTIAKESACSFIATGHHIDDQAETVLMRLIRGVGPRGIAAIRPRRNLSGGLTLIRPMLTITHADAESICTLAGWRWNVDAGNADGSRLRSALRTRVLPVLEELRPSAARAIARSGALLATQAAAIDHAAHAVRAQAVRDANGVRWMRSHLAAVPSAVLGAVLLAETGEDSAPSVQRAIVRAIVDKKRHERTFTIGRARVRVDASTVHIVLEGSMERSES